MNDERTSLERLADAFDSATYRVLRDTQSAVVTYPESARELRSAVEALKRARTSFRQLMHPEDVETTA